MIEVVIADRAAATVPPWKVVYSPVAATASRYARRVVPTGVKGCAPVRADVSHPDLEASGASFERGDAPGATGKPYLTREAVVAFA